MAKEDWLLGIAVGLLIGVPAGLVIAVSLSPKRANNLEEWEIIRGDRGLPKRIRVHREVIHG